MKAYVGKDAQTWKATRRSVDRDLPWEEAKSDTAAAAWLLKHGFVSKPQSCQVCGHKVVDGPLAAHRPNRKSYWHWRCGSWHCQQRFPYLAFSFFVGLQVLPSELLTMLLLYCTHRLLKVMTIEDLLFQS
eukprot:Skav216619  [mRNA]  locus=scaffold3008:73812:74201:- [translate_table: standard]